MYILDLSNRRIHESGNVSTSCKTIEISDRANVEGLNWEDVEEQGWLFCRFCSSLKPQEPTPKTKQHKEKPTED